MKRAIAFFLTVVLLGCSTVYGQEIPQKEENISGMKYNISSGTGHTVVLSDNGAIFGWGQNTDGQLSKKGFEFAEKPVDIDNITDVVKICAGGMQTFAIKKDGTVWACGKNNYGQLGIGKSKPDFSAEWRRWGDDLKDIEDVSAGKNHVVALRSDGTVWTCGKNLFGQLCTGTSADNISVDKPTQVLGLTDVREVAAGDDHTLALKKDGTVWGWGNYKYINSKTRGFESQSKCYKDKPEQITGLNDVVSVKAGVGFSLVLKSDGTVWTWGNNEYGQLGNGVYINETSPLQVKDLTGVIAIAASEAYSLALKKDGTVWAWGSNKYGALGDGTNTDKVKPVKVQNLENVIAVVAGSSYSSAVKSDGTVWTWGSNIHGELGIGTTKDSLIPVQVPDIMLLNPKAERKSDSQFNTTGNKQYLISSGIGHTAVLSQDGTIFGWGYNYYGQLGKKDIEYIDKPTAIEKITDVVKVCAGGNQTVVIKKDGTVWACGRNNYGQLGSGKSSQYICPEWQRWGEDLKDITDVAVVDDDVVALRSDGTVWICGNNTYKKLGIGDILGTGTQISCIDKPKQVPGLTDVKEVTAGYDHNLALKKDGTVWGWGHYMPIERIVTCTMSERPGPSEGVSFVETVTTDNASECYKDKPEQIKELDNVKSIRAGNGYSVVLKKDGTVWTWGFDEYGQLGNGMWSKQDNPVQVRNLTDVVAISAGEYYSLALKSDGTVWSWGQNKYGTLGNGKNEDKPSPVQVKNLNNIVAIAAGSKSCFALKNDGTVWAWGSNENGELCVEKVRNNLVPMQIHGIVLFSPEAEVKPDSQPKTTDNKDSKVEGASDWAVASVTAIRDNKLAEDDIFKELSKPIQRQEFAVLAVKLYQKAAHTTLKPPASYYFNDISDCKYKDYVQQAYDLKILNGSEGKFRPTDTITRQEVCILIQNLMKAIEPSGSYDVNDDVKFTDDSDIAPWARNAVIYAYKNKIINGTGESQMSPLDTTTVEQAMVLIYNLGVSKNYINK